ncbi:hypothetical protein WN944_004382 [Citrus x changshan-huyou]|uniref:Uncharacterized protein n=1 Tax=Citrus x changshan-huyou TaxID=2935761 RepID=A0AAP0M3V1_9ROSI
MYEAISYGRTVDAGTVAVAESHGLSTAAADRQPKHLNPNLVAGIEWKNVNGFNGNGRGDDDGGDWNHLIQSSEGEDNKPQICIYGFQ